jgi:hypothetical protein
MTNKFTVAAVLLALAIPAISLELAAQEGPCSVTVCAKRTDTAQNKAAWECGWKKGYKAAACDCSNTGRQCKKGITGTKSDFRCTCKPKIVFDEKKISEALSGRVKAMGTFLGALKMQVNQEELAKFMADAADLVVLVVTPAAASVGPIKPLVTGDPSDALPPGLRIEIDPSATSIELRSGGKTLRLENLLSPGRKRSM